MKTNKQKNHLGFYIQSMYISSLLENLSQKCRSMNIFNKATNSYFWKGNIKHNLNHSPGLKNLPARKGLTTAFYIFRCFYDILKYIIPKWHLCNYFLKSHLESDDLALC